MKNIFALTIALMLSGCFGGFSPSSTFYTLKTTEQQAVTQNKFEIAVEPVKIPALIDRPQIVTMQSNEIVLDISETNRWAESLSTLLQRTLVDDLSILMPKSNVQAKTFTNDAMDYIINVEVNQLNAVFDEKLSFAVRWSLIDNKGNTIYQTQSKLMAPLSDSYDDLIITQSDLVAQLAKQIAQKIATLK